MHKERKQFIFFSLLLSACYIILTYVVERHETSPLLLLSLTAFAVYYFILIEVKEANVRRYVSLSIIIRLLILFATPALSDDFYRFIWDGRLLHAGIHPFSALPSYFAQKGFQVAGLTPELYDALNSKEYFTIYPPIAQAAFYAATSFHNSIFGSMLAMKLMILLSEYFSIVLIQRLLKSFNLPAKNILFYTLNPLVILELTGNLHFEAFVITFLLASFYFLQKSKISLSAFFFSLAVCTKLLPLIFLPILLFYLGWKKAIQYYTLVGFFTILFFLPLLSVEIIDGFSSSLTYYFKKFEFNASIYYLVRTWGYWQYGYNTIQTVGWKLGFISALLMFLHIFYRFTSKNTILSNLSIFKDWTIVLLIYLLFTTTIHPWYILPLVAFSVFTNFKFPLVWSLLILFTYAGYSTDTFTENYWITAIEYAVVVVVAITEFIQRSKNLSTQQFTNNLQ